ncbi:MAG: DNA polymerase III subunit chi [Burkholderiales bacterium]|nr:DNA polymerase III subunit chi [Burkholderiales bacterium]
MTELAFHFGAPDKLGYACRLLRKAVGSGARVVVLADADAVARLDVDLWGVSPTDFVPHCAIPAAASVQSRSPVLLTSATVTGLAPQYQVLVNLADAIPQGFDQFERVIEVVSTDPADRDLARGRWRFYTEQGYTITRHDLALKRAD